MVDHHGSYYWGYTAGKHLGNVTTDDGTYTVSLTTRYENTTGVLTPVQQIWSERVRKRVGGTITLANHFKAWEDFGFTLGKLGWQIFYVEAYYSSGSANITLGKTPT